MIRVPRRFARRKTEKMRTAVMPSGRMRLVGEGEAGRKHQRSDRAASGGAAPFIEAVYRFSAAAVRTLGHALEPRLAWPGRRLRHTQRPPRRRHKAVVPQPGTRRKVRAVAITGVGPVGAMANHDDVRREPDGRVSVGRRSSGLQSERRVAFVAAALQHRQDDGFADALALERDQIVGTDREDRLVPIDKRENHLVRNAGFREANNFLPGDGRGRRRNEPEQQDGQGGRVSGAHL